MASTSCGSISRTSASAAISCRSPMMSVFSSSLGPHSHAELSATIATVTASTVTGATSEAVWRCGPLLSAGEFLDEGAVGALAVGEILHPRRVTKRLVDCGLAAQHLSRSDLREVV